MTIKEIIEALIQAGNDISFYKRKDGSYRITRINRQRYSGSAGNIEARKILGVQLSEGRARALSKLKTPKGKGSYGKRRKAPIDEETKKLIRRLQRIYRKAGKKEGKPTIRNYRYIMEHYGKEEADRLLRQSERRILGLAYEENVFALYQRIMMNLYKSPSSEMNEVAQLIMSLKDQFLDRWIYPIYEILYDWERKLIVGEEAAQKIRAIISR